MPEPRKGGPGRSNELAEPCGDLSCGCRSRRHLDAAEQEYRKAAGLKQRAPEAHYGLARVLVARKKWQEAEAEIKQALESNPNSLEAHYVLARIYQQTGKNDDALREYRICSALRLKNQKSGIAGKQP